MGKVRPNPVLIARVLNDRDRVSCLVMRIDCCWVIYTLLLAVASNGAHVCCLHKSQSPVKSLMRVYSLLTRCDLHLQLERVTVQNLYGLVCYVSDGLLILVVADCLY